MKTTISETSGLLNKYETFSAITRSLTSRVRCINVEGIDFGSVHAERKRRETVTAVKAAFPSSEQILKSLLTPQFPNLIIGKLQRNNNTLMESETLRKRRMGKRENYLQRNLREIRGRRENQRKLKTVMKTYTISLIYNLI